MDNQNWQKEFCNRLEQFVLRCKHLCDVLPKNSSNTIYKDQLLRSSSSIYANYLEATCALTKRDFINDVNKARKEAKESQGWLKLIYKTNFLLQKRMLQIIEEISEIVKILSSCVKTAKGIGSR